MSLMQSHDFWSMRHLEQLCSKKKEKKEKRHLKLQSPKGVIQMSPGDAKNPMI